MAENDRVDGQKNNNSNGQPAIISCPPRRGSIRMRNGARSRKASTEPSGGAPAGCDLHNSEAGSSDQARVLPASSAYL